jgi:hypothetical protein
LQLQGPVRGGVGTENEEVLEVVGDAEDNGIATASSGAGSSKTQIMVMFAASLASRVLSDKVQLESPVTSVKLEAATIGGGIPIQSIVEEVVSF